jgi:hypothetical protein
VRWRRQDIKCKDMGSIEKDNRVILDKQRHVDNMFNCEPWRRSVFAM